MKYITEITINDPLLYQAIKQEKTDQERAKTTFTQEKSHTKIKIIAKDLTALKSHIHSMLKMIETWEKMKAIN